MPLTLRHNTQQQNLPSALSHGVGLPVSDGGLGAASRALSQVAGAAGDLGARLQRREQQVKAKDIDTLGKAWQLALSESESAVKSTLISNDAEAYNVAMAEMAKLDPRNKDFKANAFLPAQSKSISFEEEDFQPFLEKASLIYEGKYSDLYHQNLRNRYVMQYREDKEALSIYRTKQLRDHNINPSSFSEHLKMASELVLRAENDLDLSVVGKEAAKRDAANEVKDFVRAFEYDPKVHNNPTTYNNQLASVKKQVNNTPGLEEYTEDLGEIIDRKMEDSGSYVNVRRTMNQVDYTIKNLSGSSTSVVDSNAIQSAVTALEDLRSKADSKDRPGIDDRLHYLSEMARLQLPEHTEERAEVIRRKLNGEDVWSGSDQADMSVRSAYEKRFENLAKRYSEATSESEKLKIMVPFLEAEEEKLFTEHDRPTAMAKYRTLAEDIRNEATPKDVAQSLQYSGLTPGRKIQRDIKLPKKDREEFTTYKLSFGDGDSFKVIKDGKSIEVRLDGYDAPEYKDESGKGAESTEFLNSVLSGKKFTVVPVGKGHYGRMLVDIVLEDGTDLRKLLIHHRKGLDNPNFGKKQSHATYDSGVLSKEEKLAYRDVAEDLGYNPKMEVPRIQETADRVFEKEGKLYKLHEGQMLDEMGQFLQDAEAGGFKVQAIADKYIESTDPELQTLAAFTKFYQATGGDVDSPAMQALVYDEMATGITKSTLVDPAIALINKGEDYTKTSKVVTSLRASRQDALANMLEGYHVRAVNYLVQSQPGEYKQPEKLAKAADSLVGDAFRFIEFSKVSDMPDVAISSRHLTFAGISTGFWDRVLDSTKISPKEFARTIMDETESIFVQTHGDLAKGVYIYDPAFENSDLPDGIKQFRKDVNEGFQSFLSGDASKLRLLMKQGKVRMSYETTDDVTGEPLVTYSIQQKKGQWKLAEDYQTGEPLSIPLSELKHVFENTHEYIKYKERSRNIEALRGMDPYSGLRY